MTETPRDATRINGKRRGETSPARRSGRHRPGDRTGMYTAVVAAFSFVMGALAATVVLNLHANVSQSPVIALGGASPDQVVAVGLAPPRTVRDVLVEPNVDPTALPKDRTNSTETVGSAIEARRPPDQHTNAQPAGEPWPVNLQQPSSAPNVPPPDMEAAAPRSGETVSITGFPRAKSAVNLRSSPDKDSDTVGVVPADAPLQVVSCEGWCEVVYDGRRGFIYESFIDGATR